MANVHFIGGEKGGVGKSMTSRLLAQYYIDTNRPFMGFDSDASHSTFSRFYGDFASPVMVGDDESLDSILETCETQPDQDLVIDLAAQTSTRLGEWIEETDVFGLLEELGHQVYLWHVMDDGKDSVDLLEGALARAGGQASEAARALKLPRKTFYDKLAKHGVKPDSFR